MALSLTDQCQFFSAVQMELDFIYRVLLGQHTNNNLAFIEQCRQLFADCTSLATKDQRSPPLIFEQTTISPSDIMENEHHHFDITGIDAKRPKRQQMQCKVCGRASLYCYYGVKCCESCKQFFRRVVAKRAMFNCSGVQNCQIGKDGIRCRGCRLDKCLLMGMDPRLVNITQNEGAGEFLRKLEMRKRGAIERLCY